MDTTPQLAVVAIVVEEEPLLSIEATQLPLDWLPVLQPSCPSVPSGYSPAAAWPYYYNYYYPGAVTQGMLPMMSTYGGAF
jgi:hypothetical protein